MNTESTLDLFLCLKCHCLAARRRARELTRLYESKLKPHGLRATQFSVLVALAAAGPVPIGTLAGALGVERTTLTRGAILLVRNGWVTAEGAQDGRERHLRLTEAGRAKLEAAYPAWKVAQNAAEGMLRTAH